MELSSIQIQYLLKRFPSFELSYETIAHKKVFPEYNLGLAIPNGKKYFAWFSFQKDKDVCYLLELNKEKKITKVSIVNSLFHPSLCLGTLVYGTIIESVDIIDNKRFFIIEDIFYYKGLCLKNIAFGEKLGFIEDFLEKQIIQKFPTNNSVSFFLPVMWSVNKHYEDDILSNFDKIKENIPYTSHHIQLRKLTEISPYLNIVVNNILSKIQNRDKSQKTNKTSKMEISKFILDYNKPQYKYPTIFQVTADIQFDIYHLFAYGKNNSIVYYNVAYIPNIKTSYFMNSLFRNIRENKNIDYIEESDEEDDFENISEDKYVNLNKIMNIECIFNYKFKRWIPIRVVEDNARVVHINRLVNQYN